MNHLSKANEQTTEVPCGKCAECARDKINSWYFRIQQEIKVSTSVHFVTLTYDEKNLPLMNMEEPTLRKRDCQLFLKKLRKKEPDLRYYMVGEYGTKSGRPHYHAIMFNIKEPKNIQKEWGKGFTFSPKLDTKGAEIRYVLKYINKPKDKKPYRENEFSLMSKGIGKNYLTPQIKKYHLQSVEKSYVVGKSGEKIPMPKYYKEKIYTEDSKITRAQVTKYLAKRSEEKANESERLEVISSKMYTEEEVLRNRDIRKSGIVFESRKEKL